MNEPVYAHHTGAQTLAMLPKLTDLYREARAEDPHRDDPLFSRQQFTGRTQTQARRPGFELVTAERSGTLIGFSFGLPFAAGTWWADATPPPEQVLQAAKFAVIELDVHPSHQGQGIGRTLLNTLLSQRPEPYATLATIPGSPAQAMYERWTWHKAGTIGGDGPEMNAMLIAL